MKVMIIATCCDQIYSNNLSNLLVSSSIEFLVKQLYVLHRFQLTPPFLWSRRLNSLSKGQTFYTKHHPSLQRKPFLLQMFGSIANSLDISRNGWAFIIINICIVTTMATTMIIKPCSDHHNSNRPGSTPDPFRIQPFGLYQLLLRFEELSFEQYLDIWLKFWYLTNN